MTSHHLSRLPGTFAVCRLEPGAVLPAWATTGTFSSITRTTEELSIVCDQGVVPDGVRCERDWRCLKLAGPIPFTTVGVLASLVQPLADAGISVFAISTFVTDYVLVKERDFEQAVGALRQAGHTVK
jgi:hypothetical protein